MNAAIHELAHKFYCLGLVKVQQQTIQNLIGHVLLLSGTIKAHVELLALFNRHQLQPHINFRRRQFMEIAANKLTDVPITVIEEV